MGSVDLTQPDMEKVWDEFVKRACDECLELIIKLGPIATFDQIEKAWNEKYPGESMFKKESQ